jgi:hypothetical protein
MFNYFPINSSDIYYSYFFFRTQLFLFLNKIILNNIFFLCKFPSDSFLYSPIEILQNRKKNKMAMDILKKKYPEIFFIK